MKNMVFNQKLMLLMLITVFLMCWFQGVSHGGSFFEALFGFGTGLGTAIGATVGGVGTALGVTAGTVLTAVGAGDIGVAFIDAVTWQPGGPSNMAFMWNRGWLGFMDSNRIHLGNPYAASPHITLTYGSSINSIGFDPGGSLLASGSVDNTIQLWDLDTATLLSTLEGHTDSVLNVAFSPDGSLLASGGADGLVGLWDPDTETLLATLETHTREVLNVAFSPDGLLLASGSGDGLILLWDLATETAVAKLETHMDDILGIAFSPDGTLLASASADGLVGLWNLTTETLDATLGHESPVLSVAFSSDGDLLATGSADGVARLWDPHVPEHIGTLGHESPVTSVGFDGNTLVSRSEDGAIRRWEIAPSTAGSQQLESVCQVGDILSVGESCTYPGTDSTFSVLNDGRSQWHIPNFPLSDKTSIGGSLSFTATINGKRYHFVATARAGNSWEIIEIGDRVNTIDDGDDPPRDSESQPEGITASTATPLTEATLDESVVTLTLNGGTFERSIFKIREAVTVSGISGVTVRTYDIDRVSDTKITVELTFDGTNLDTSATLTFTVGAGAITNYSGSAFTAQIPVSASRESLVASTTSPLTEATLDGAVVTLTLSGRTFERSSFRIGDAVTVSGISGVTVGTFDVDRVSDTKVTVELTFGGNINTDSTLTFTVEAGAIANYSGSGFTAQVPVASGSESLVASSTAPLTEATLNESVVTLTLSGRTFESWSSRIRNAITVSGISGVTVRTYDIDRVSDITVTVELTFDGTNFDTDKQLTFTVGAGAIAGYDGPAITDQIPVTAITESMRVSTATPLTDTNLDGSVVTLTLSGRSYNYTIGRAITVSGIDGVTVSSSGFVFKTYDVNRISDTQATVELSFTGSINTDSTLTFTVGASAIEGYNGPALTAEIHVAASADVNNDGVVDTQDLVLVASNYGQVGQNTADVNNDGVVDIDDLTRVAGTIDNAAAAPLARAQVVEMFTAADVKLWLYHAQRLDLTDTTVRRGILFLEQLLAALLPRETVLLPNYPNPFNPETWIPYHLASDADVLLSIYEVNGALVRELDLGYQQAGYYTDKSRAAYWNGRNEWGERVASGVYFYQLQVRVDPVTGAGDYSQMRKMVILK